LLLFCFENRVFHVRFGWGIRETNERFSFVGAETERERVRGLYFILTLHEKAGSEKLNDEINLVICFGFDCTVE
jgi:hypothetical protein